MLRIDEAGRAVVVGGLVGVEVVEESGVFEGLRW